MRRWIAALTVGVVVAGSMAATSAEALPIAPQPATPVTGIPTPCVSTVAFPADASIDEVKAGLEQNFGFKLAGKQWTKANSEPIKILWETLDAMECTSYRTALQSKVSGQVGINAGSISGYAWGDWSLTKGGYVTMDFSKFQGAIESGDEGRLTRLVAHELAHVLNSDRDSNPDYWRAFKKVYAKQGRFSDYAGRSITETFADVVGYYVGRCALDNPYNTGKYDAYYEYAKTYIFGGKEFGPAPGEALNCTVPSEGAEAPMPGSQIPDWLQGLSGE